MNSNSCKHSDQATAWSWSTWYRMTMSSEVLAQLLFVFIQFPIQVAAVIMSMFTPLIQSIKQFSEVLNWLMEPSLYSKNWTYVPLPFQAIYTLQCMSISQDAGFSCHGCQCLWLCNTAAVLFHEWVNCCELWTPKPQFASHMIHNASHKWLCSGNVWYPFHMQWTRITLIYEHFMCWLVPVYIYIHWHL